MATYSPVKGIFAMDSRSFKKIGTVVTRSTLVIAYLCAIIIGGIIIYPKFAQLKGLEEKRNNFAQQTEEKKTTIKTLKDKQHRFNTDPEFVESIARQNKRVKPGEFIFVPATEKGK